jgi:DNA-binding CsgD family transcriptional regulator
VTSTSASVPLDRLDPHVYGRGLEPLGHHHGNGRALRDALDRLLAGRPVHYPVRPEILESWRRAGSLGLRPECAGPLHEVGSVDDEPLRAAAEPVVTALGEDLAETNATVVLAGDRGRILGCYGADRLTRARLDRLGLAPGFSWSEEHAGTNGVGTAFDQGSAAFVAGDEHFAEILTGVSSGGAPVAEPHSGFTVGAVAILRRADDASRLMLTVARQAARDVERRLGDMAGERQPSLHDCFLGALRHTRGPLALVAPGALLTNASAAGLLAGRDGTALWSVVSDAARSGRTVPVAVPLRDGRTVLARCEAVREGRELVAALVRLAPEEGRDLRATTGARRRRSGQPRFGWASLSSTELVVADLAASGRTNRQIAQALVVSPHTVDSHIRHIYGKLGISSRIELTRLVLAHCPSTPEGTL